MKVSIITPTYNDAKYIRGTIESVLSQTSGPVEHIIVDGGSTDGTIDLLESYPHLRWVTAPDNGMYDAINKGIRMASGDVVAYLNADDRYHDHSVQAVVDAFARNPDLDFVYGACTYIDEQERTLFVMRPLPYAWAKYSLRLLWPQPSWFWKKTIHDRVGLFDDTLRCTADADFMRRLVVQGLHGKLIRTTLAKFMLRDTSISSQLGDTYERERRMCIEKYQANRWSLPRAVAEVLFALQNITTYPRRVGYHRMLRNGLVKK